MGFILALAAAITAGYFIIRAIYFTFNYLRDKVRDLIVKKKNKKVLAVELKKVAENTDNKISYEQFKNYQYAIAGIDENGEIKDEVELIKDLNSSLDADIERLLTSEGKVLIEA